MQAMVLHTPTPAESSPLRAEERPLPVPGPTEVRVRVERCGVCRTDLHVVEGDLPPLRPSVVPGHEVVGRVDAVGGEIQELAVGDRVGVPWLRSTCGRCEYCRSGRENLCPHKSFTGYTEDGGYAEALTVGEGYAFRLPEGDPAPLAPLLCAGIVGYRALKLALPRPGGRIGFFGFGGSAHLTLQLAAKLGYETVAYSRNPAHRRLASRLGASETVATDEGAPPGSAPSLDAAVVFAPSGEVVAQALAALKKGGTVAVSSIHSSPLPSMDYDRLIFGERRLVGVEANTREDAREFLDLAFRLRLESVVTERVLLEANAALADLKHGIVDGAVVLDPTRH